MMQAQQNQAINAGASRTWVPMTREGQTEKHEAIQLWKKGQFAPLTGEAAQYDAVGHRLSGVLVKTVSGNEYLIMSTGDVRTTPELDTIHSLKVINKNKGTSAILTAEEAAGIVAEVGKVLDLKKLGSTSAVKEILALTGKIER